MSSKSFSWINALIVDDSHAILNFSATVLKQQFAIEHITKCCNGLEALTTLKNNPNINLLLLDLNMPEMDGIQFLEELVKVKYKGFLVIMSGVAPRIITTVEELAKQHRLNYLGSLLKPLDAKDFTEVLNRIGDINKGEANERELKIYEVIRAIKNESLEVYYQPQVNIHTRKVYGVEVLVRLDHPTLGVVAPDKFLSKIEQTDLIDHLTFIILRKSFRDWLMWKKQGIELKLSINISPHTLQQPQFVDQLLKVMEEFHIDKSKVCLEVTENTVANSKSDELATLSRLNMKGIELALDDFGQDHASIERIQSLPINVLKLDKSFFIDRKNRQGQIAIIESCIAFAKRLHMTTVAEGIEDLEHWKLCSELGCDVAQGFYLSKPVPGKNMIDWLVSWQQQID